MNINRNDLAALASTYQTIIKESHGVEGRSGEPASEHIRHKDQTPYTQDDMGINTSHYKTVQPGMGKKDKLDDATMQAALAILHQYAQGDISNVEAAEMFEDLYKKGTGHGPTQDDQYYTKLN
jgi:hypothetical protein